MAMYLLYCTVEVRLYDLSGLSTASGLGCLGTPPQLQRGGILIQPCLISVAMRDRI